MFSTSTDNNDLHVEQKTERSIPIPTEVQNNMANEEEYDRLKDGYFDLIHGYDSITHWKAINQANFQLIYEQRKLISKAPESFANGELVGEWQERGSNNQAGNVRVADFDPNSENIYAISDGGTLWRGHLDGNSWIPLNDAIVFDANVVKAITLPTGELRILAAVGNEIWFSDDEGENWTESTGFSGATHLGNGIDLVQLNDNDSTILYLYTQSSIMGGNSNKLAYSTDHGESFNHITSLDSYNKNAASMSMPLGSEVAYIIDLDGGNNPIYKYQDGNLTLVNDNNSFNGNSTIQIESNIIGNDTLLYVLADHEDVWRSQDGGSTFDDLGSLPTTTWDCGIGISFDNPDVIYYGEVELYRTWDAGSNWEKVANWWDYYGDVFGSIHADIMKIQTFRKSNGDEFTLIPNHGGISVSYDDMATTENIGMIDLNVGQLYDVATSPVNSAFIFGGTQDQGLQRTSNGNAASTSGFEQFISGDYGHQQFSNNGYSFWTQYPGGIISYLGDATNGNWFDFDVNIEGTDLPNYGWIFPTSAAPNPSDDYILVGGGSLSGGSGSYLIKVENIAGNGDLSEFPFDFKAASGRPIAAIETTPLNPDKWYVATENGRFYYSNDAGNNWTESEDNGPGNSWIYSSDIYASRLIDDLVYFGGTNYFGSAAWKSIDGGVTFEAIGNGLPSTMIHELCMNPDETLLFAATDAGPYVYSVAQNEWFYLGSNQAPVQSYTTVEFVEAENTVRFATYGRGIWDFQIQDNVGTKEFEITSSFEVYPNPVSNGYTSVYVEAPMHVFVVDLQGKEVFHSGLIPGKNTINLSHLNKGTYLLVGIDNQGNKFKRKILIAN